MPFLADLFKSLSTHSISAFRASESDDFPIVKSLFGSLFFQMLRTFQRSSSGPYRQLYDFGTFAYPLVHRSFSPSVLDLVVLYHANSNAGLSSLEFLGDSTGIYNSTTALLEAAYGWQSTIILKSGWAEGIRTHRRALAFDHAEIKTKMHESAADDYLCDFLNQTFADEYFDYVYFENCELFLEVMDAEPLKNLSAHVVIVSHWWSDHRDRISDYLLSRGYSAWLPEFTQEHFVFVETKHDTAAPAATERMRRHHNLVPKLDELPIGRAASRKAFPFKVELVGVHVPKTGGSSLLVGLNQHYGDWLFHDYGHDPGNPTHSIDQPPVLGIYTKAVYGHFRADRYLGYSPQCLFTFIRDPVELLVSVYFYWKTSRQEGNPEYLKFVDERPTLMEFAARSGRAYVSYFGGIDLGMVDFIGNHATYDNDLETLGRLTGIGFPRVRLNVFEPSSERLEVEADGVLMGRLKDLLRNDYATYELLLEKANRLHP